MHFMSQYPSECGKYSTPNAASHRFYSLPALKLWSWLRAADHVMKQVYYSVMTHALFYGQCRLIFFTATLASCSNMRHCFHLSSSALKMW